jgi:molecular chaperone GrpE
MPVATFPTFTKQDRTGAQDVHSIVPANVPPVERRLRAENDSLRTQLLQFEERAERARMASSRRGLEDRLALIAEIASAFLPMLDGLELARATSDATPMREGLERTCRQFERTLTAHGFTAHWPTPGQRFDPAIHEAVEQETTSAQSDGCIVRTLRVGYSRGAYLLRPALVTVACEP